MERIAAPWVVGVEVESRKKKKRDMRTTESIDNIDTVPRQRRQKACWYFAISQIEIYKRTDTTVAFTQEYSRISYPQSNVRTLSTGSGSSKDTHLCRIGGMRGFPKVQNKSLVKI